MSGSECRFCRRECVPGRETCVMCASVLDDFEVEVLYPRWSKLKAALPLPSVGRGRDPVTGQRPKADDPRIGGADIAGLMRRVREEPEPPCAVA